MAAAVQAIRKQKRAALEAQQVQDVFAKYDADGSGAVDKEELMMALSDLGMTVSGAQADKVLKKYLPEGSADAELNKDQFMTLVQDLQSMQAAASPRASPRAGAPGATPLRGRPSSEKSISPRLSTSPLTVIGRYLPIWKHHETALQVYQNKWMQMLVAALILGNFFVNITEKEIDPFPAHLQRYGQVWEDFDKAFNIIFLFELLLNAWSCGGPYRKFWSSGWNNFDFLVVAVGILLMSGAIPSDSPLSNLKMMRAFRVFRLFKRIKSLNKVIMALLKAIPGVSNAFVIMVIIMMIYAILAVEYFAQLGQGCVGRDEAGRPALDDKCFGEHPYNTYLTTNDDGSNQTISAETARGFVFGWEYYGTFTKALYTLFQVMTGESWSEAVARPLLFGLYGGKGGVLVSLYFVSFILLMQIVLTNVVVAVLLDKFVEDPVPEANNEPPPQIDASDFLGGMGLDDDEEEDASVHGTARPSRAMADAPAYAQPGTAASVGHGHGHATSPAVTASPSPSSSGSKRAAPPYEKSGFPVVDATVAPLGSSSSLEDKLNLLLQEMVSLRVAVGRCEAGLEELRHAKGSPRKGRTGSPRRV